MVAADEIERLVREVLKQLDHGRASAPQQPEQRPGEVRLTDRVVTLAALADRLSGTTTLVVPANAVVTPAVRDELRRRQVTLAFAAPAPAATDERTQLTAALFAANLTAEAFARTMTDAAIVSAACLPGTVAKLAKSLEDERSAGSHHAPRDEPSAIDVGSQKAHHAERDGHIDRLGLLATDQPALAACLANRRRAVRAVLATSHAAVNEAITTIGANLLIVDTRQHNLPAIRSLARMFARQRKRVCPKELEI